MNKDKKGFLLNTVFSYSKVLLWGFPFYFGILLVQGMMRAGIEGASLNSSDIFNLFSSNKDFFLFADPGIFVYVLTVNIIFFALVYMALKRLNLFLLNVFANKPFIEENGKHLKYIGAIVVLITIILSLKDVVLHPMVSSLPLIFNILIKVSLIINILFDPYLILGLFTIVVGEIISNGSLMKDELDLTV